jgi:two-component system, OmpR family, sensor kinase
MEDAPKTSVEDRPEATRNLDALSEVSARLAAPASVLLSVAPRLATAVDRGDSRSLLISADIIERNAENLAREIAEWEGAHKSSVADRDQGARTADLTQLLVHEVRTPITIIQGCAATLRRALDHLDRRNLTKMAEAIERSAVRLSELIASFQDAEGFSGEPSELRLERFELGAFANQILKDLEPLTNPHPTGVLVAEEIAVSADPVRMRQVITNLVGNAVKFTPANSVIRVTVDRVDNAARLSVTDNGPGIPEDRRDEVFERFARINPSVPGAGLGLWVSKAIAHAHGGDLTVTSSAEGGACFVLTLPTSA